MSETLILALILTSVVIIAVMFMSFAARKHARRQYLYYSNLEPVLANFGFLLQTSGFFTLPSIAYAYYLCELNAVNALLINALVLLGLGFFLSFLFEPKAPNLKQSCMLLTLFYTLVPLVNCIPFLYLRIFEGNILDQLLNSWFETSSAFSTTGLTLLEGTTVPKSLTLARGLSEWNGGIGIVFILLSSFFPSESLFSYARALGMEKIARGYKASFGVVLLIYAIYTIGFSVLMTASGLDFFIAFHTTLTVFSTTGLTMVNVLKLPVPAIATVTVMMLFSAFSFTFHLKLLSSFVQVDWKSLLRGNWNAFVSSLSQADLRSLLTKEFRLYLFLLFFFTIVFWHETGVPFPRAFFHIVDFSTSCGLNLVDFKEIGQVGKIILVIAMLVGPMSFSVGGGIRVFRVFILMKALLALPKTFLTGETSKIKLEEDYLEMPDFLVHLLTVLLYISVSFLAALVLCNYGYSLEDALVESVSAITTTGDSPKTLTPALPFAPKLSLITLMLMGRIEIIPIFIAFSRVKETRAEYYRMI